MTLCFTNLKVPPFVSLLDNSKHLGVCFFLVDDFGLH